jgi:hypothetical protein
MRSAIQNAIDALAAQRQVPDLAACATAINRHHGLATKRADQAIHHASEAGRLLLQIKAALPHGEFQQWFRRENVRVSVRQAQRYMSAAMGKPPLLKTLASKSDTMSHLPAQAPAEPPEHLAGEFKPDWQPTAGHWHFAVTDSHGVVWVVADSNDAGLFHVSRLYEEGGESLYDGTPRPLEAWLVEDYLRIQYCIEDAWLLPWKSRQKPGLSRPFGDPSRA